MRVSQAAVRVPTQRAGSGAYGSRGRKRAVVMVALARLASGPYRVDLCVPKLNLTNFDDGVPSGHLLPGAG